VLLPGRADAVPAARRFTATSLADTAVGTAARDDAALVVAELVGNAVLHGVPPIAVRVHVTGEVVHLAVRDAGGYKPLPVPAGSAAMTGRGLALVAALSREWGVDSDPAGGKVVWADVDGHPPRPPGGRAEPDLDALLAAPGDVERPDASELVRVDAGELPTELLLAVKRQIDDIVRELTLAAGPAAAPLPPPLARLVTAVTVDFADARRQIKEQALQAAARGEPTTRLVLSLPRSAAEAGERYLAALEDADRHARAAQLLTLETPGHHRALRRRYITAVIDALRRGTAPR
jgi:anti-sigma regulatory factor (Ser/Thr protein kinase)